MATENIRDQQDQELQGILSAMPAAGANSNTPSFDLGYADPTRRFIEKGDLVMATPQMTGVNGQTVTCKVQDSADNSSFADVSGMSQLVVTGASSLYAASSLRQKLPQSVRRYVRMNVALSATGGTPVGKPSISLRL
jgi:hypothetical protein